MSSLRLDDPKKLLTPTDHRHLSCNLGDSSSSVPPGLPHHCSPPDGMWEPALKQRTQLPFAFVLFSLLLSDIYSLLIE